ncbi:DgyrCDS14794 [Dimorphilus gyrociliatus]|uniref:DgyrCDS14794 n=1 Tax=Dimorphilus gyrociliatus TaxID=2664684 RepID=A0A7I8WEV6_9ANNE|nr:DgyrCDS14794 [Dimorphilus gyrociliatus]
MNLLYQNENQGTFVENVFQVGFGDKSVTKGVSMTKVPIVRTIGGQKTNIFFLDSQGLFSTDLIRGDNLIVSFLFSLCSIVIYNADKRLANKDVETINVNSVLGVVDNEQLQKSKETTLVVVLRNRSTENTSRYGKFDAELKSNFMALIEEERQREEEKRRLLKEYQKIEQEQRKKLLAKLGEEFKLMLEHERIREERQKQKFEELQENEKLSVTDYIEGGVNLIGIGCQLLSIFLND